MDGRRLVRCCEFFTFYSSFSKGLHRIRFLYILYISVDANFKLKGKERNLNDVELMPGWGAYVPEKEFKDHIANHVDRPEVHVLPIFICHTAFLNKHAD